jgi:hypothetical protein
VFTAIIPLSLRTPTVPQPCAALGERKCLVPVAQKMLLQVAARDIGQLTGFTEQSTDTDITGQSFIHCDLGHAQSGLRLREDARSHPKQAAVLCQQLGDRGVQAQTCLRLAMTHEQRGCS